MIIMKLSMKLSCVFKVFYPEDDFVVAIFFSEINSRENLVVLTDLYSFILKILYEIHYISTINVNKTEI